MLAILDSGLGGLSAYISLQKAYPTSSFLYYADNENFPYGEKSKEEISKFSENAIKYLIELGASSILIACHTISVNALPSLKEKFSLPIYSMIEPTLLFSNSQVPKTKMGMIATKATIATGYYQKAIPQIEAVVDGQELVSQIESGYVDPQFLQELLSQFPSEIKTILLLCTHFPLIQFPSDCNCFDPSTYLTKIIPSSLIESEGNSQFIISSPSERFPILANYFLEKQQLSRKSIVIKRKILTIS